MHILSLGNQSMGMNFVGFSALLPGWQLVLHCGKVGATCHLFSEWQEGVLEQMENLSLPAGLPHRGWVFHVSAFPLDTFFVLGCFNFPQSVFLFFPFSSHLSRLLFFLLTQSHFFFNFYFSESLFFSFN